MSSLWTPGGEVPVDRRGPTAEDPAAASRPGTVAGEPAVAADPGAPVGDDEARAQAEAVARLLLETPAAEVVAQHAVGLYELAALHLSQPEADVDAARLAVDALDALVSGVGDRLGPVGSQLTDVVAQLKLAVVERSGSTD